MVPKPYLSTVLSDTQHCLLSQSGETDHTPATGAGESHQDGVWREDIRGNIPSGLQGSSPQSQESPLSALTHRGGHTLALTSEPPGLCSLCCVGHIHSCMDLLIMLSP